MRSWVASNERAVLVHGDCLIAMAMLPEASVDCIFADPPYFLSNGGSTCRSGKRVSVSKGDWDKSMGVHENHVFNRTWLQLCQRALKPNGTIWVSGTSHVIYSVGFAMQQLGFKHLNQITWEKPNPPPNLSCRYFTHSTETILWAGRDAKTKHHFAYSTMREDNGGKQMKSVWTMTAPGKHEKTCGKHPTQKPLSLLERIVTASCPESSVVMDPFSGSGTTGVAALRLGHRYIGIEREPEYVELTKRRLQGQIPSFSSTDLEVGALSSMLPSMSMQQDALQEMARRSVGALYESIKHFTLEQAVEVLAPATERAITAAAGAASVKPAAAAAAARAAARDRVAAPESKKAPKKKAPPKTAPKKKTSGASSRGSQDHVNEMRDQVLKAVQDCSPKGCEGAKFRDIVDSVSGQYSDQQLRRTLGWLEKAKKVVAKGVTQNRRYTSG